MKGEFNCTKCGWCCRYVNINVSYHDILRWASEARYDILAQISYIDNDDPQKRGFYITDTVTSPKKPCPFLGDDNLCGIYETRPRSCADFPIAHSERELDLLDCPALPDYEIDSTASRELKKDQLLDFVIAEDRKERLLHILADARLIVEAQKAQERIREFGADPTESLYATGFTNNKTGWTRVGTTPWLSSQNQPTDYVWTATKKAEIGDWSFANTTHSSDTLNSVTLYVYGKTDTGVDRDTFYIHDGTSWNDAGLGAFGTGWGWVSVDISTILDTWTKVDAAQLYIAHDNSTDRTDVDAAYLLTDYSTPTVNIGLASAGISVGGQTLAVSPGAVSKAINTAGLSLTERAITVSAAFDQQISLSTAIMYFASATFGANVAISTAGLSLTGNAITVSPGAASIGLSTAGLSLTGNAITVFLETFLSLNTANILVDGVVLAVIPGAASVSLATGLVIAGGESLAVIPGAASVSLATSGIVISGVVIAVQPGTASVLLATADVTLDGIVFSILPGAASTILATAIVTVNGQVIAISLGGTQVNKDIQALWDIANLANKDNQAVWDLLNLIGKDNQAVWDLLNLIGKDNQALWDIANLAGKDNQALWDIANLANKDNQALWDLLNLVSKDNQAVWDIANLVGKDNQAVWDIANLSSKDIQALWDMAGPVGLSVEALWDILSLKTGRGRVIYLVGDEFISLGRKQRRQRKN